MRHWSRLSQHAVSSRRLTEIKLEWKRNFFFFICLIFYRVFSALSVWVLFQVGGYIRICNKVTVGRGMGGTMQPDQFLIGAGSAWATCVTWQIQTKKTVRWRFFSLWRCTIFVLQDSRELSILFPSICLASERYRGCKMAEFVLDLCMTVTVCVPPGLSVSTSVFLQNSRIC
jgi:hypothetical protein